MSHHEDEDLDGLEGKLIVRLNCKHGEVTISLLACRVLTETDVSSSPSGIVKTHRLVLQTPSSQLHLHVPEALNESHVVIGPKAMRDMIDHFPSTRGKADPQLIWVFDDTEVQVRSFETSLDGKGALDIVSSGLHVNQCNTGAGQLATELTISADEFENYDIFATPISLAFHLREFNVSLSFSTQSSLAGAKIYRGY